MAVATTSPVFIGVHRAAEKYPKMTDEEVLELAQDIEAHGQQEPIWLDADGYLVDGRNRLEACRIAGVIPRFETYHGDDIEAFIVSKNEHRRHLTDKQRIELRQQRVKDLSAEGKSTAAIADIVGVGRATVARDIEDAHSGHPLSGEIRPERERVDGSDGKSYPARRRTWTTEEAAQFLIEYRDARTAEAKDTMRSKWGIKDLATLASMLRKRVPDDNPRSKASQAQRDEVIRDLAKGGMNASQIAKEVGITENTLREYCRTHDIEIAAEKAMGKMRRLNSNRIIDGLVHKAFVDLENDSVLSAVDFSTLNRERLADWASSLALSIKSLTTIKNRLTKELARG